MDIVSDIILLHVFEMLKGFECKQVVVLHDIHSFGN